MKKAFTMLELVFVIVVIGILAAAIIPSTRTNPLQEAAVQVLSHIRYTQHLAMMDDKYDASDANWYKKRWQIVFSNGVETNNNEAYTIFSDTAGTSTGKVDLSEVAINPSNVSGYMSGGYAGAVIQLDISNPGFQGMKKLNLGQSYGVNTVVFSPTCRVGTSRRIAFDHMGRPIKGDLSGNAEAYENDNLIQSDCNITMTHSNGDNIIIKVEEETGYSCILNAAGICI